MKSFKQYLTERTWYETIDGHRFLMFIGANNTTGVENIWGDNGGPLPKEGTIDGVSVYVAHLDNHSNYTGTAQLPLGNIIMGTTDLTAIKNIVHIINRMYPQMGWTFLQSQHGTHGVSY